MKLYAIPNCDTVKKARKWLDEHAIAYAFHDYKKHGVDEALLQRACEQFGWEQVVNRKGMTWRKLDDEAKAAITDAPAAMALMREKPSVIKRPIAAYEGGLLLGFDVDAWENALK